ncbi:hypothetical protein [Marinicella meishanensis]|uniref:hypothetical protein n=1 Tax=Marinicella meishanensis TaxID=2873263 RepID=UPI001CBCE8DB|nr:hypothetical protein [Marinicella sp. NBU2979]
MNIRIACAMGGRDLALIKSILSLQSEYNGSQLSFTEDTRQSDVLVVKDYLDDGAVYYALNRKNGQKTPILPNLNPKSLRHLFSALGQQSLHANQSIAAVDQLKPFKTILLEYMQANSDSLMMVASSDWCVLFDKDNNRMHANRKIDQALVQALIDQPDHDTEILAASDPLPAELEHSAALENWCWQLGLDDKTQNMLKRLDLNDPKFKLISWPNFGELKFKPEFIQLCSGLWHSAMTQKEIIQHMGVEPALLCQFLNATLLTGHLAMVPNHDTDHTTTAKPTGESGFIFNLKRLFGF